MTWGRLLFVAALIPAWTTVAQTRIEREESEIDLQSQRQQHLLLPGDVPPVEQFATPETSSPEPPPLLVDERPLWRLLQTGRLEELNREIEHLRGAYPGWQPPEELSQYLIQNEEAKLWGLYEQERLEDLQGEIERLRETYSDWKPPDDLQQLLEAVDEGPLWHLYAAGRLSELQREIERLRRDHPSWSPTPELTDALSQMLEHRQARATDAAITQAIKDQNWKAVIEYARIHEARFRCERIDFLWGLADAYSATGRGAAVFGVYRRIVTGCRNPAPRVTTLERARRNLHSAQVRELLALEQKRKGHTPAQGRRLQDLGFALKGEVFRRVAASDDTPSLERALADWAPAIERRRDTAAAREVAWVLLERERLDSAADWFARALEWQPQDTDARYGLAQTRSRQGRYAESNRLLDNLAGSAARDHDQTLLHAWNDYHLRLYDAAVSGFLEAYREQADGATAAGLGLSLERAKRWQDYENLATELGGPLARRWQGAKADRLKWRGLHRASWVLAPGRDPLLMNLDSPWLEIGIGRRNKLGEPGTSRLVMEKWPSAAGAWYWGEQGVGLTLDRVRLDSDTLRFGTPFGSFVPGEPWITAPITSGWVGTELRVWWQQEGWLGWHAELGVTPTDGVLDPRLVGSLGLLRQTEAGAWSLDLFLQPVRESVLSYVGAIDPYTGGAWGRVRRGGGRLSGHMRIDEGWSLSGSLELAAYRGEQVANNTGVALSSGVSHNLELPGFDYFSLGPEFSYLAFDKNLSHFTLGHGGYFSPEQRFAAGLSVLFQAQHQRLAVRGRLYAGWASQREAASPCFPLSDPTPTAIGACADGFPKTRSDGLEVNGELAAALRLHSHVQLLLGTSLRDGINYQDSTFTVGLRVSLDPRPAVLSSDLPEKALKSLF